MSHTTTMRAQLTLGLALTTLIAACGSDPSDGSAPILIIEDTTQVDRPDDSADQDMAPAPDLGPPALFNNGEACDNDAQCEGGRCSPAPGWPGGYCTANACEPNSCGRRGGGQCAQGVSGLFCGQSCAEDAECRNGYSCTATTLEGGLACEPTRPEPTGSADGEACARDADCMGGTCVPAAQGWPGGYCTTLGCESQEDCASPDGEDNRCLRQRPALCVRICTSSSDCREGYLCQALGASVGACLPDTSVPLEEDFSQYPFPITCEATSEAITALSYSVNAETTSYMMTPIARDGKRVIPRRIELPDGRLVDMDNNLHAFQSVPAEFLEVMNPTLMAAAPQFQDKVLAGDHSYLIQSESQELCHYLLQEETPGTALDLNIYLVGVPNVTAASAAEDANIQEMLAQFDTIYEAAGVSLRNVRFLELSPADTQSFRVIRSDAELGPLVSLTQRPGPSYDDVLSLNVFFVQRFAMRGGAIGVSLGLPGPAGLHGTPGSGVVFTSEFLGRGVQDGLTGQQVNGNNYTGIVMAHEVGHYLGLFHTTESSGQVLEPLQDTPQCSRGDFPNRCPDINNLMFPLAGISHTQVSPNQASVIQANPLTKAP